MYLLDTLLLIVFVLHLNAYPKVLDDKLEGLQVIKGHERRHIFGQLLLLVYILQEYALVQ